MLSQQKPDDKIEINLDLDELDLTSTESKPTYEDIKGFILNKYGLKVSSLYIAQVKEKMGIKERRNYNISKSQNVVVPNCPKEKEYAIIEAFNHFKMV